MNATAMQNDGGNVELVGKVEELKAPKWMVWTGRVLSTVVALMMVMSAAMKLSHQPQLVEMWVTKFGFAESALKPIGILELICVVLYIFPRTTVLGAILLTGYLGGAVVTHLRVSDPYLVPVLLGVVAWAGIYLRTSQMRRLLPLRRNA